jgi:hypothetical protein
MNSTMLALTPHAPQMPTIPGPGHPAFVPPSFRGYEALPLLGGRPLNLVAPRGRVQRPAQVPTPRGVGIIPPEGLFPVVFLGAAGKRSVPAPRVPADPYSGGKKPRLFLVEFLLRAAGQGRFKSPA